MTEQRSEDVEATDPAPHVEQMRFGPVHAKVVVAGLICITEERDEDEPSEVYMEADEATALRDWLNKVLP